VDLPGVEGVTEEEATLDLSELTLNDEQDVFASPDQLEDDLVTLTLLPRARWKTLLNLDVIQKRNKPIEPPKAPEKAPFFLPTLPGVEHRFDVDQPMETSEKEMDSSKKSKKLGKSTAGARSRLQEKMESEARDGAYDDLFDYIKTLSPAAIDLELRSLTVIDDLKLFLHALDRRLTTHRDFEAVQALINVFLRIHGEVLIENDELLEPLKALQETQKKESRNILELLTSSLGVLNFVRDIG